MNDYIKQLKEDKSRIIEEKRCALKKADAVSFCKVSADVKSFVSKDDGSSGGVGDRMQVEAVINTTGLFDSHYDVHIPGLWDKSLSQLGIVYLLQEHQREFDHVISDEVKVSVSEKTWAELGAPYEGSTQALVFSATLHKQRNPYMYEQYRNGYVRNHSVGMRYVSIELCINSEERNFTDEKAAWDKYVSYVANREDVEAAGYFWAVTEAKIMEGSAVLFGSNWVTPTVAVCSSDKGLFENIGKHF